MLVRLTSEFLVTRLAFQRLLAVVAGKRKGYVVQYLAALDLGTQLKAYLESRVETWGEHGPEQEQALERSYCNSMQPVVAGQADAMRTGQDLAGGIVAAAFASGQLSMHRRPLS